MYKFKKTHTTPVFWVVLSPEYETSLGGSYEPPEWGRDCLIIRALSAKRAKVIAIRAWRRKRLQCRSYITDDSYINPMAELTVHRCLLNGEGDARVL